MNIKGLIELVILSECVGIVVGFLVAMLINRKTKEEMELAKEMNIIRLDKIKELETIIKTLKNINIKEVKKNDNNRNSNKD